LVDEDTAATNLMIRDARMQALVAKQSEPLTPFVDLVRPLSVQRGVSTVLVMGGSGDYMDVADLVLMMDGYRATDVTARAREVAAAPTGRASEADGFPAARHRVPDPRSIPTERPKVRARGADALALGESTVDLRAVEQLVDPGQVTGIGLALVNCVRRGLLDGRRTMAELLDAYDAEVASRGMWAVDEGYPGDFAVPRRFEVAAALNRLRTLHVLAFRQ
jgi:predicted ABC-class ATPase